MQQVCKPSGRKLEGSALEEPEKAMLAVLSGGSEDKLLISTTTAA
jgi:hypothetical protein